jgi:hypothetical protein
MRERSLGLASGYIVGAYREVKAAFTLTPVLPCFFLRAEREKPDPPQQLSATLNTVDVAIVTEVSERLSNKSEGRRKQQLD